MQPWPNSDQPGSDGHTSWQQGYGYADEQNGQFDPNQTWPQPMSGQTPDYSHMTAQDGSTSNYFESAHPGGGDAFLAGHVRGDATGQHAFHGGHDPLAINQQFAQPGQDVIDPAFSDLHQDIYGQSGGKINLGRDEGIQSLSQSPGHHHAPSQPFTHHEFSYAPQNERSFEPAVAPQYTQAQLIPQQSRQQNHTPVQQPYDSLQGRYPQSQAFSRPQQSPVQHQPPYSQNQPFSSTVNNQPNQYQPNPQIEYQSGQQPQQQAYRQPSFSPKPLIPYPQSSQTPPAHQALQPVPSQTNAAVIQPAHQVHQHGAMPQHQAPPQQQNMSEDDLTISQAKTAESPPKKRKRATKSTTENVVIFEPADSPMPGDSSIDAPGKRLDEVDGLTAPEPSAEEAQSLAQAKEPSIKGLPHILYDGVVKLPAPKSYDKLSPFVALPSRSGRRVIPELGLHLSCEVQGRFTSQYRPTADRSGLDERRAEAKTLLDAYDHAMQSLGKRRPKYTEYPHAFKEQLKSDEASKNKAEKRAKKEMEDERSRPMQTATRPTDPIAAAAWDAISFVQIDKSTERTSALIAGRVQQAGDLLIQLRTDMNRAKLELDQAVKDKAAEADMDRHHKSAELKKEAFYQALDATIEHADDAVLDNLGGHQKLILSLVNALIASIKAGDFSGKLPKAVLELFTHFRMTKKIAETTNFDSVRKRFSDKGDEEVKDLVREISSKVKKATKAAEPETATGYTGTSAASRAKAGTKATESTTKRGRDEDTDARIVKKVAVESGASSLSKKLAQPKAPSQSTKTGAAKSTTSSILPGKTRPVVKSIPKPEVVRGESPSNSDEKSKLVAKMPEVKAEVPKPEAKAPAPKNGTTPSSSAASGIASLLDSINSNKAEAHAAIPKETRSFGTMESSEDRAKRLRKEGRRKLRVSWKPDEELVQIKVFEKDEAEEQGLESNMIRDAADDRSEGMVLKQRANVNEDDDEDDIPYQPWVDPVQVDFSVIAEDARSKNYVTRGGNVTFTTDEQKRIAELEQRELMVIYTDPTEIPLSPKSPQPDNSVATSEPRTGYFPPKDAKHHEVESRWRDVRLMGADNAIYAALHRLNPTTSRTTKVGSILDRGQHNGANQQDTYAPLSATAAAAGAGYYSNVPFAVGRVAEELVLAWLASDRVKIWRDPHPVQGDLSLPHHYNDPAVRLAATLIEPVARSLAGKPYPATSPPEWIMGDEEKVREWWFGYNKELASRQRKADGERARSVAATGQANNMDWSSQYTQQQYAPYMALLQQMTGGQQPPATAASNPLSSLPDNQLQSILAAINQPSQGGAQSQPPNPASYLNPNDPSYQQLLMLTQMTQGQQPPPPPPPPSGAPSSDRDWDWAQDQPDGRNDQHKDYRDSKDAKKKKTTLPPHKPVNKALIGTKSCTFWQQGKCARGDKCTFRHD